MSVKEKVMGRLLKLDDVIEQVRYTDSLRTYPIRWKRENTAPEGVRLVVKESQESVSQEYFLDYEGTIKACSLVGISEGYARKFPKEDLAMLLPQVNYFDRKNKPFTALVDPADSKIKAFTAFSLDDVSHEDTLVRSYEALKPKVGSFV